MDCIERFVPFINGIANKKGRNNAITNKKNRISLFFIDRNVFFINIDNKHTKKI